MGRYMRRFRHWKQEIVKLTRRIVRKCCCGQIETEVRQGTVPVELVLSLPGYPASSKIETRIAYTSDTCLESCTRATGYGQQIGLQPETGFSPFSPHITGSRPKVVNTVFTDIRKGKHDNRKPQVEIPSSTSDSSLSADVAQTAPKITSRGKYRRNHACTEFPIGLSSKGQNKTAGYIRNSGLTGGREGSSKIGRSPESDGNGSSDDYLTSVFSLGSLFSSSSESIDRWCHAKEDESRYSGQSSNLTTSDDDSTSVWSQETELVSSSLTSVTSLSLSELESTDSCQDYAKFGHTIPQENGSLRTDSSNIGGKIAGAEKMSAYSKDKTSSSIVGEICIPDDSQADDARFRQWVKKMSVYVKNKATKSGNVAHAVRVENNIMKADDGKDTGDEIEMDYGIEMDDEIEMDDDVKDDDDVFSKKLPDTPLSANESGRRRLAVDKAMTEMWMTMTGSLNPSWNNGP